MSTHLFVAEWNRMSPTVPTLEVVETKRVLAVIFGTVAVLAGSRMAYKYIRRRELRARARERDLSEAQMCVRNEAQMCVRSEAQMCVVCIGNPKEVILLPCGHVCLCQDCSNNIPEHCPICRNRIEFRARAFIA